jgi:hypothetical protein
VHTELRVERNKTGQHRHSADRSVIDLVSDLSKITGVRLKLSHGVAGVVLSSGCGRFLFAAI